jgi:transcriptional regulator with XRE-family HTH domain
VPAHLTPEQIAVAVRLQARCWTQDRIAAQLGVAQSSVSRALARVNERLLERLLDRTAAVRGRQIARLEWIADRAAEAAESEEGGAKTGLLRTIISALADERKILGLDRVRDTIAPEVRDLWPEVAAEALGENGPGDPPASDGQPAGPAGGIPEDHPPT